jgi:hypothetical protein
MKTLTHLMFGCVCVCNYGFSPCLQRCCDCAAALWITEFLVLSVIRYSKEHSVSEPGFVLIVKCEGRSLLGPLEKTNLKH